MYPYSLQSRVEACIGDARQGMAVMLRVEPAEKAEAERLVGDEPVIVATHSEAMQFLCYWMQPLFGQKRHR